MKIKIKILPFKYFKSILILIILCTTILTTHNFQLTAFVNAGTTIDSPIVWGIWTEYDSPYYINQNITVPYGETLIIEAGVNVICNGSYNIVINGNIIANGSAVKRITFYGNYTGNPSFYWLGLHFNLTGTGELKNCTINNAWSGVYINGSRNVSLENCILQTNIYGAILNNSYKNNSIRNCNIYDNRYGVVIENSTSNHVRGSSFVDNTNQGLFLKNSSHNYIKYTTFFYNGIGLYLTENSSFNNVSSCELTNNAKGSIENDILIDSSSRSNIIYNSKILHLSIYNLIDSNMIITGGEITNIYFFNTSNISLIGIKITEFINLNMVSEVKIIDCESTLKSFNIYVYNSNNIEITDSDIHESDDNEHCVYFSSTQDISLVNCSITSRSGNAIHLNKVTHGVIDNCVLDARYTSGLFIGGSSWINVSNTRINSEDIDGLLTQSSDNITLYNCNLNKNGNDGADISFCSDIYFLNCDISNNTYNGIRCKNVERFIVNNSQLYGNNGTNIVITRSDVYFYSCTLFPKYGRNADLSSYSILYLVDCSSVTGIEVSTYASFAYIGWYLDIIVRNTNNNPVEGALINISGQNDPPWVKNSNEYYTDDAGEINNLILFEYMETDDSVVYFVPYMIIAFENSYGISQKNVYLSESKTITMVLDQVDLVPVKITTSFEDNWIPTGEPFTISVEIRNDANQFFENVKLSLWIEGAYTNIPNEYMINYFTAKAKIIFDIDHYPLYIPGTHEIIITIDSKNEIAEINEENNEISKEITIADRPVAVLEANRTRINTGQSILFLANKSYGQAAIKEHIFNFDDGTGNVTVKTANKISHIFNSPGDYLVTLWVKDIYDILSEPVFILINVSRIPKDDNDIIEEKFPKANFTVYPKTGDVNTEFIFNPSNSIPSKGGNLINFLWNFGDGVIEDRREPPHRYKDDGKYTVSLQVKDDVTYTFSEYYNITITVQNLAPTAYLQADNYTVTVGEPILFDASRSTDLDDTLNEPEARFIWYFGDEKNSSYTESSIHYLDEVFDKKTEFTYEKPGIYNVTLVIYDDDSARNETMIQIEVLAKPIKNQSETDNDQFDLVFVLSILSIVIVIIIIIAIFVFIFRRKKKSSSTEETSVDTSEQGSNVGIDTDKGTISDIYQEQELLATGQLTSKKVKAKDRTKLKDGSSIATRPAQTNHFQPPAVEVTLPKEKVVEWKAEDTTKEHVLSLKEVTVVSDQDLLHASPIGVDDNGQEFEPFPFEVQEEEEDQKQIIKDDPDLSFDENETDPEEIEWMEGEDDIGLGVDEDELLDEEEFELEEVTDEHAIDELVETDEEMDTDDLVFEFEDDGEILSEHIPVSGISTKLESDLQKKSGAKKGKKKKKKSDMDPLIPIPGVGFVRRSELQDALGIGENIIDRLRRGKIKYKDIQIPEDVPLKINAENGTGIDTGLRCKTCFRPISGKFIKVRRKGASGTDIGIIGPFCSSGCAKKFQDE